MSNPSLSINFNSYIGCGVKIDVADSGKCILQNVFLSNGVYIKVSDGAFLSINNSSIGQYSFIVSHNSITIQEHCSIAEMVVIRDQDHDYKSSKLLKDSEYITSPIHIGKNVWLGAKATILKGVTIGNNSVVAADSVVTKNIPENTVFAGIPAVKIKETKSK